MYQVIIYFYTIMNLVVDIGNTRVKAALYEKDLLLEFKIFNRPNDLFKTDLIKKCSNIIVSSVVYDIEAFISELSKLKTTTLFSAQTKIPIQNNYQSITTLGSDRIAASVGAYYLYPKTNVLVIDAGTCIKYNFTNKNNEYLGGGISPGVAMKFKALNQFTAKLPLIDTELKSIDLIGTHTESSIISGVLNGTIAEIDGIIEAYQQQHTNLVCILTGGNSHYFANRLKNSIFTHQNLVLKGLNDILNYNIEGIK